MSKPLYRSNPDTQLAAARRDIEMLKRRPFGLGGIRFNVLNDSGTGGFLDVTTHDYTRFVNDGNSGTQITDTGTSGVEVTASDHITILNTGGASTGISIEQSGGSAGIAISDSSSTGIYVNAANQMQLTSAGGMSLEDDATGIKLWSTGNRSDHAQIGIESTYSIGLGAGDTTTQGQITLSAYDATENSPASISLGGTFTFPGSPFSGLTFTGILAQVMTTQKFAVVDHLGFPVFEARGDGTVHIRSAHTVVADL